MSEFKARLPKDIHIQPGTPFLNEPGGARKLGVITEVKMIDGEDQYVEATVRIDDEEMFRRITGHPDVSMESSHSDDYVPWREAEQTFNDRGEPYRRRLPQPIEMAAILFDRRDFQALKLEALGDLKFQTEDEGVAFFAGFYTGNDLAKLRLKGVNLRTQLKERRRFKRRLLTDLRYALRHQPKDVLVLIEEVLKGAEDPPADGQEAM